MIRAENISFAVQNHTILSDISLKIAKGQFVVLIGPNGSGKSSLLRCLSGWHQPQKGSVTLHNTAISKIAPHIRAQHLAWLPQRLHLSEPILVQEWIASARFRFQENITTRIEKSKEVLCNLGIEHLAEKYWNTLSGGEAQRVALAAMKAQESEIWLLDEPANHLDPAVQKKVYRFLVQEWQQNTGMVLVTHNINLLLAAVPIEKYSNVIVIGLQKGKQVCSISLDDEELPKALSEIYDLPVEKTTVFGHPYIVFGER